MPVIRRGGDFGGLRDAELDKWAYTTFVSPADEQMLQSLIDEERQSHEIGYQNRIELLKHAKARRFLGSDWAEPEFRAYQDSVQQSGKSSAHSENAYDDFISALDDVQPAILAAPPEHPELEDERGKVFTALLASESASGTTLYNLRKRLFGPIDWIEQTEAEEIFKEISPSQALGITTRETRVWTPRGVVGLGIDVGLDPLTYIKLAARVGGKTLDIARRGVGKKRVGEEGITILEQQTKWIREEFGVGAKEAREAAESLVYGLTTRQKKLLAARKYQEPSFSIFGQPLFYWGDVKKMAGWAWEGAPYHKKRQALFKGVETEVRKTFEPFYEVGQAAGERGKDIFKEIIRRTEYERGVWDKRAKELYTKGPKWWRRKEVADVHEQTLELIQRGVEPTDPRAYAMAEDLISGQREMAEAEIAAGLLDPKALREGYVFRVYEPKFREEVFEKEFGYTRGEDITVYVRQLESRYPRMLRPEASHKEINEWAMKTYGIKALVTDPSQILLMRGIESSRARATAELYRRVGMEVGIPAEQIAPLSKRRYKKYTQKQIDEMVGERYDEKYDALREELDIPLAVEIETPEDIALYLERGRGIDVTGLVGVPSRETVVAKAARERADRYDRRLRAFYRFLEDIKTGEIRPTTVQDVEKAIELESRGLFAGLRPALMIDAPATVGKYMEAPLTTAKRYVEHEKTIFEIEKDIIHYEAAIKKEKLRPRPSKEDIKLFETQIVEAQERVRRYRELQDKRIAELRERVTPIRREILEPSERKIAHQRYLAGEGITASIDWGVGLPTDIGGMPAAMPPIDWATYVLKRTTTRAKLEEVVRQREVYRGKLVAKVTLEPLPEDVMLGEAGARRKFVKHPYQLPTGEARVSYIDEAVAKELTRSVEQSQIMLDNVERLMRWGYTVPHIAFHARNIQGIMWQNLYYQVSPKSYAMNWEILHGDPNKIFDVPIYGKMTAGTIRQMYEESGIYGKTGYIQEPMRFKDLPMGPMPEIESLGRGALATELLMAGKGIDEAARTVRQVHFEYGTAGLTAREQRYARRAFLFYTWPRKNVELTTRMLAQQPSTMAAAIKFQQAWITPDEYEQLPAWAKELYVLTYNGEFYVLDVPFIQGIATATGEGYAFSHTPLLKAYIGAVWGRDPATGRPLGMADMPEWFAEAGVGRFMSLRREVGKAERGEIPWTRMAKHQVGGVYIGELEDIPLRQAYLESLMVEWRPTEEEKIAAFEASGMTASHYEMLWRPDPGFRGERMEEPAPWWQKWPWEWGYPWEEKKPEYVGEKGIVVGYSPEEWEIIAGHKLSDEQKSEVKQVYEIIGAQEAAQYRVRLAAQYHEARATLAGREPISPEMITEARQRLLMRVGPAAAEKWHYRAYYSEEDKLLGIMGFTEEEWEDVEGFQLSEAQKQWMFRKTLTSEEAAYNEWVDIANKLEATQSMMAMVFPRPAVEPHLLTSHVRMAMMQEWRAEREAEIEREEMLREEYRELREDPLGVTRPLVGVPAALMLTRGGQAMQTRHDRAEELENLLGVGVDR